MHTEKPDWESIIEGCKAGQHAAQKRFYDYLAPFVQGVCRRYLVNQAEAEDAMIKALYKALVALPTLQETPNLKAWLRRITVNECLMILRSKKDFLPLENLFHPEAETTSVPDQMEADQIHKLVAELPAGYRAVFNLYVVEGYNHREIGELLGISINTSKSQLIHARRKLAEAWRALNIQKP